MRLEKLSALAELVSAVAIVITLAYLAIQTQQNTAATEAMVRQSMLEADQETLHQFIQYPVLNRRTGLTFDERTQLSAHITAFIRSRENQWLQYRNDVLDQATWESYRGALVPVVFSSEYGRALWNDFVERDSFAPGFTEAIDEWRAGMTIVDREFVLSVPDIE